MTDRRHIGKNLFRFGYLSAAKNEIRLEPTKAVKDKAVLTAVALALLANIATVNC